MSEDARSQVRYAEAKDRSFWFRLDRHLPGNGFERIVREHRGYVVSDSDTPKGLLRYGLFWDWIPFCNLIIIDENCRGQGLGRKLIQNWEADMCREGYELVMTSTQVDESAQHFYRKLGYRDCGGLLLDFPGYEQPMELFLAKIL